MILVTIIDRFSFAFHPLERNIFLDQDVIQDETKLTKLVDRAGTAIKNFSESIEGDARDIFDIPSTAMEEENTAENQKQIALKKKRQNLIIDKKTFDTLKTMQECNDDRNMYELIYSKNNSLKDDNRLTYYSFYEVMTYPELKFLSVFSIFYIASISVNLQLAQPKDSGLEWPFTYYVFGAATGLTIVALLSDFIFQQRMCFGPPFAFVLVSFTFHITLLFLECFDKLEDLDIEPR